MRVIFLVLLISFYLSGCKSKKGSQVSEVKAKTGQANVVDKKPLETVQMSTSMNDELPADPLVTSGDVIGEWQLISWMKADSQVDIPFSEWDIRFTFKEDEVNNLRIKGPCNNGGCNFKSDNGKIQISNNCFFTEMYCMEDGKSDWETKLVEELSGINEAIRENNKLTLKGAGTVWTFKSLIQ